MNKQNNNLEIATFGAGCFWGIEATFRQTKGVVKTSVGFMGGNLENPSYEDVCTDQTGHAEVVQIEFDPTIISYEELLTIFWECHNPTEKNRQGPDIGSQYRSVIFYHNEQQQQLAEASKDKLVKTHKFDAPIVTNILPADTYYLAEEYHQQYLQKRGQASCRTKEK